MIGAGLAGLTVGRWLAEAGSTVAVVERGGIGAGASGRNGGFLLRRADPWLEALRAEAVAAYATLDETGSVATGLRARPLVLVASDGSQLVHGEAYAAAVGAGRLDLAADPWLAPDLADAWVIDGSYTVDPMAATLAAAAAFERAGGELWPGCEVRRLLVAHGRVRGVATDAGTFACERVVVCAGPHVRALLAAVGIHLPAAAVRGWLHELAAPADPFPYAVEEALWPAPDELGRLGVAPTLAEIAAGPTEPARIVSLLAGARPGGAIVVGTSLNRSLREEPESEETARLVAARAVAIVPRLAELEVVATWSGRRTMTPDGRPLVGPVPGVDGLELAGAFSSVGMVTIPGLCRALAEGRPDPTCDPGRFVAASAPG